MKVRKIVASLMLPLFVITGCVKIVDDFSENPQHSNSNEESVFNYFTQPVETTYYDSYDPVNRYDMLIDDPTDIRYEVDSENRVQKYIANKSEVILREHWLEEGESLIDRLSTDYMDMVYSKTGMVTLYENDMLVALDEYLERYDDIKEMYSDYEWDQVRMDDGHIYWIDPFDYVPDRSERYDYTGTNYTDISPIPREETLWIKTGVLEWKGYPEIKTLDQYFDLLDEYYEANPTLEDGTSIIPFTTIDLNNNVPVMLDGYPNDVVCAVDDTDPDNPIVMDYNTTETAKRYFSRLNEEWKKGILDPDFSTQTYDEYIAKIESGCVLGLCDEYSSILLAGQNDYVPLGLTLEEGIENHWNSYSRTIDPMSGVGITADCPHPEGLFYLMLVGLYTDIHTLRFWGVEGEDYLIDDNGLYYRTDVMRERWNNPKYRSENVCEYKYLPQRNGEILTIFGGKQVMNAAKPADQPGEFFAAQPESVQKCLEAYGVLTFSELVGSTKYEENEWFPLSVWAASLTDATEGGMAYSRLKSFQNENLPGLVMSEDFEASWNKYVEAYNENDPSAFFESAQMMLRIINE